MNLTSRSSLVGSLIVSRCSVDRGHRRLQLVAEGRELSPFVFEFNQIEEGLFFAAFFENGEVELESVSG